MKSPYRISQTQEHLGNRQSLEDHRAQIKQEVEQQLMRYHGLTAEQIHGMPATTEFERGVKKYATLMAEAAERLEETPVLQQHQKIMDELEANRVEHNYFIELHDQAMAELQQTIGASNKRNQEWLAMVSQIEEETDPDKRSQVIKDFCSDR